MLNLNMMDQQKTAFEFGPSTEETVRVLRQLADAIERKDAIVQKAVSYKVSAIDNFGVTGIVLHFVERSDTGTSELRSLNAPGISLPVDVVKS